MSRHFLCAECVREYRAGTRKVYERSEIGEPAEFERVVIGIARAPQPEQRWMAINGVRESLPLDAYNCDHCNADVKPGEPCGTWTIWTEEMREPIAWEHEFLEPTDGSLAPGARLRDAAGDPEKNTP